MYKYLQAINKNVLFSKKFSKLNYIIPPFNVVINIYEKINIICKMNRKQFLVTYN